MPNQQYDAKAIAEALQTCFVFVATRSRHGQHDEVMNVAEGGVIAHIQSNLSTNVRHHDAFVPASDIMHWYAGAPRSS
jgi:hypothetical protein